MKKSFYLAVIFFTLMITFASAEDVAYIYLKDYKVDQNILDVFDEMDLTVDLIKDSDVPRTDFDEYKIIFVNDELFRNEDDIPISEKPTVIANYYHGEEFGLTDVDGVSQLASRSPLEVKKDDRVIKVYTQARYSIGGASIPYYFLDDENKASGMMSVARTHVGLNGGMLNNDFGDVISYADAGLKLKNGKTTKAKICFYGIVESDFWTPAAKEMFEDCVGFVSIACYSDSDCPSEEIDEPYCKEDDVYRDRKEFECTNPGTPQSQCVDDVVSNLVNECGEDSTGSFGNTYCKGNDVFKKRTIVDRGCTNDACFSNSTEDEDLVEECSNLCLNGECVEVQCIQNIDCPDDFYSNNYCSNDDVYKDFHDFSCSNGNCTEQVNSNKVSECGSDSTSSWENFCKNNDVYRKRTVNDKGCSNNQCFVNNSTEEQFVEDCSSSCSNGACVEDRVHDVALVDFTDSVNKMLLEYSNGTDINNTNPTLSCTDVIKVKVKVENQGDFTENIDMKGDLEGVNFQINDIDNSTPGDTNFRSSLSPYILLNNLEGSYTLKVEASISGDSEPLDNVATREINIICGECSMDSDCEDDFYSNNYCNSNNVYRDLHDFSCRQGSCIENITRQIVEDCSDICTEGSCEDIICNTNSDCGTNKFIGDNFCSSDDVYRNFLSYICQNPGTTSSYCTNSTQPILVEQCSDTCVNGICGEIECRNDGECSDGTIYTIDKCVNPGTVDSYCTNTPINCANDADCGPTGFIGSEYCSLDDIYKNFQESSCVNPGTVNSYCDISIESREVVDCGEDSTGAWSNNFCVGDDVYRKRNIVEMGCNQAICIDNPREETQLVEECSDTCNNGVCITRECNVNNDCGTDFYGEEYCSQDGVFRDLHDFTCDVNYKCRENVTRELVDSCVGEFTENITVVGRNNFLKSGLFIHLSQNGTLGQYPNGFGQINDSVSLKGNAQFPFTPKLPVKKGAALQENSIIYGDIDNDGSVDYDDYNILYDNDLNHIVSTFDSRTKKAADVNLDFSIDVSDLIMLNNYLKTRERMSSGSTSLFIKYDISEELDNGVKLEDSSIHITFKDLDFNKTTYITNTLKETAKITFLKDGPANPENPGSFVVPSSPMVEINEENYLLYQVNGPIINTNDNEIEYRIEIPSEVMEDAESDGEFSIYLTLSSEILALKDVTLTNSKESLEISDVVFKTRGDDISQICEVCFGQCRNDEECDDGSIYTIDSCQNPGTPDSYCTHTQVNCVVNADCGTTGFIGGEYCSFDDIYKDFRNSTCINPGTVFSYCNNSLVPNKISECGEDIVGQFGNTYCVGDDVYRNRTTTNKGCNQSSCFSNVSQEQKILEECSDTCIDGECVELECRSNLDCQADYYSGNYCSSNGVYRDFHDFSCSASFTCNERITNELVNECGTNSTGAYGNNFCVGDDVYRSRNLTIRGCSNNSCFSQTLKEDNLVEDCQFGCSNGVCLQPECRTDSECSSLNRDYCSFNSEVHERGICVNFECTTRVSQNVSCGVDSCNDWSNNFCLNDDVYKNRTCYDRGCSGQSCFNNPSNEQALVEDCQFGCSNGVCLQPECRTDSDCDFLDSAYCSQNSEIHIEGVCSNFECKTRVDEEINCGSGYCSPFSDFCKDGNVWERRTCYDQGCLVDSCFIDAEEETRLKETCSNGCFEGDCILVHDVGFIDLQNGFNKILFEYSNGTDILGQTPIISCREQIKATVKVENQGDFIENFVEITGRFNDSEIAMNEFSNFRQDQINLSSSINLISLLGLSGVHKFDVSLFIPQDNDSSDNYVYRDINVYCPECINNLECGSDYYSGDYCSSNGVYRDFHDFSCNVGNCVENVSQNLVQDCGSDYCSNFGVNYCKGDDVYRNQTCFDSSCLINSCSREENFNEELVEECQYGCLNGICEGFIPRNIPLDIMLVLDNSGSINDEEFAQLKNASLSLVNALGPSHNTSNIGISYFNTEGGLILSLSEDQDEISEAIQLFDDSDGSTHLESGMLFGFNELLNRDSREEAPDYIIIITDGVANRYYSVDGVFDGNIKRPEEIIANLSGYLSNRPERFSLGDNDYGIQAAISTANSIDLRNTGIFVLGVGITDGRFNDALRDNIATSPAFYYTVDNYQELEEKLLSIVSGG